MQAQQGSLEAGRIQGRQTGISPPMRCDAREIEGLH